LSEINDTLSVRSYKGDSVAGGMQSYGLTIDTTPIDKLAAFTFYEKKDLWERKNKKDDEDAKKLAEITALDPANSIPELYDFVNNKKNEVIDMMKDGMPDYQKDPDTYVKFQKAIGELKNLAEKAAATELKVSGQRKENEKLGEKEKIAADKYLDASINNFIRSVGAGKYLTNSPLIETGYKPDAKDYELKVPKELGVSKVEVVIIEPNGNRAVNFEFLDYNKLHGLAQDMALSGKTNIEVKRSDYGSDAEYNLAKSRADWALQISNNGQFSDETLANGNKLIFSYLQGLKEGREGIDKLEPDVVKLAKEYNSFATNINKTLEAQMGNAAINKRNKGDKTQSAQPLKIINFEDGIDKTEMIFLKLWSNSDKNTTYTEKVDDTQAYNNYKLEQMQSATSVRVAKINNSNRGGGAATPTTTGVTGNALDSWGNETISDGNYFNGGKLYNRDGSLKSVSGYLVPASMIPEQLRVAASKLNIPLAVDGNIKVNTSNGEITAVYSTNGGIVDRNLIRNAQLDIDKERKGEAPMQWGQPNSGGGVQPNAESGGGTGDWRRTAR
jgi:hypothetical protein